MRFSTKHSITLCPFSRLKARRVGGVTYQVPIEVRPEKKAGFGTSLAYRVCEGREANATMKERLAGEILMTNNMGGAVKKKDDTHKMAEANKAFASMVVIIEVDEAIAALHRKEGIDAQKFQLGKYTETSVLWHTLTQGKPPPPKEFCSILVVHIKLAKLHEGSATMD